MGANMAGEPRQDRLAYSEIIGYGLGDMACNVMFQMVLTFMPFFYTDVYGLEAATMGALFLIARAATALADPIIGLVCDRTETRWGKFRPYLLWMSLPFAVIGVLAFTTPDFSPFGKQLYACITYPLLLIIYAAINVPYCALGGVITGDAHERVRLNGYRSFLATAGGALVAAGTLPLVHRLGAGNEQRGYQLAMMTLMAIAVVLFLTCFLLVRERVTEATPQSAKLWQDVKVLFSNDQWRVVAALTFVLFAALVIQDGATVYYVTWYVGRSDMIPAFLTAGMVSSMIGSLCAGSLTARLSKANAYSLLQALIIVASVALFFTSAEQVPLLFVLYALQQFFTQMASPILWSMIADTADYGEYATGRRITGLTFSAALLALKMGTAVGGALLGGLLAYVGYHSQSTNQSAEAIYGIVVLFTLVPTLGHATLIGLARFYSLDADRCIEIRKELSMRVGAGTGPSGMAD